MGRIDEAIAYLERAVEILDTDPVVFDHLGEVYARRREWEKARRSWERALELEPSEDIQEKLNHLLSQEAVPTP